MRRLLILVCALVAVDTMLYAALTPLLPRITDHLHLSKGGALASSLCSTYRSGVTLQGPGAV